MEKTPPILFDRTLLRKRRAHAAANFEAHDFLHREAAERLIESLAFITHSFPVMVELGAQSTQLATMLSTRPGTSQYIRVDLVRPLTGKGLVLVADEEYLPFAEGSVDAVVGILSLHWVNDLPGCFAQIARILKPDGLFMAILPGGETLAELRHIFAETETARSGGVTPRVAPFIDLRDAGALLQRAGFALPVTDSDQLTVTYPDLFALMRDLRGAAQANLLHARSKHFTSRGFFLEAARRYGQLYSNAENHITATVELVTLTAWKPAATQQQPARRGSGKISLTKALQ